MNTFTIEHVTINLDDLKKNLETNATGKNTVGITVSSSDLSSDESIFITYSGEITFHVNIQVKASLCHQYFCLIYGDSVEYVRVVEQHPKALFNGIYDSVIHDLYTQI